MKKNIYKLMNEQFNIGNMDLSNNKKNTKPNIFNQNMHTVYDDIMKRIHDNVIFVNDVKLLNDKV